jgi:hypothetical protein
MVSRPDDRSSSGAPTRAFCSRLGSDAVAQAFRR